MWEAFKNFIFWCIQGCHSFVGDWGLAIILITIIFRLLISPLMQKQIKSSYQTQKVQPLMQEIQSKYAHDQQRMAEEMQKLYAETGFNPIAGCLPIFLQMPIFMALFEVLRNMQNYIEASEGQGNYAFYNIIPDLTLSPGGSLAGGIIQFLPYVIVLILFAGATFLPMILQQRNQPNSQQKRQMFMMAGFMSLFMLWIGWNSPAGVLLFWATSSIIGIAQQQLVTRHLKRKDAEAELATIEVKPVEVEVTRKVKKKRPTKQNKSGK